MAEHSTCCTASKIVRLSLRKLDTGIIISISIIPPANTRVEKVKMRINLLISTIIHESSFYAPLKLEKGL